MPKTINICGRPYRLRFNNKKTGATFSSNKNGGDGEIVIGTKSRDLISMAETIMHESIEAITTEDFKRFYNYRSNSDNPDYVFIFDHDYLCVLVPKIINGLLSSGFFKIIDGRPKQRKL